MEWLLVARLVYFMINFSHSSITFQLMWPHLVELSLRFARLLPPSFFFFLFSLMLYRYIEIYFVLPTPMACAHSNTHTRSFLLMHTQPLTVVGITNDLKWFGFSVKRQHSSPKFVLVFSVQVIIYSPYNHFVSLFFGMRLKILRIDCIKLIGWSILVHTATTAAAANYYTGSMPCQIWEFWSDKRTRTQHTCSAWSKPRRHITHRM